MNEGLQLAAHGFIWGSLRVTLQAVAPCCPVVLRRCLLGPERMNLQSTDEDNMKTTRIQNFPEGLPARTS